MKKKEDKPLVGYYGATKQPKRKGLAEYLREPEKVWILEYFSAGQEVWCYIDKGKGVPFGPWKMERAIQEMDMWAKQMALPPDKTGRDSTVPQWRIRNLETNEVIPQALFGA